MKSPFVSCRIAIVAAVVGSGTTLLAAWPSPSVAANDAPPAEAAALPPDGAKIGDLLISTALKPGANGRWVYELRACNTSSERTAEARLQAVVEERVFRAESRSGPVPEVAWHVEEAVSVPPGETTTRAWTLPAPLAFRIARSIADLKRAEAGQFVPTSRSYLASVRDVARASQSGGGLQAKSARAVITRRPDVASPPSSGTSAKAGAAPPAGTALAKSKPTSNKVAVVPSVPAIGF